MYIEEKSINESRIQISFYIPEEKWEQLRLTESWNDVSERISRIQSEADFVYHGVEKRIPYCISYCDIPLMQEVIKRIDNMHKRLLVSIILPVIALVISIVALLVQ